MPQPNSKWNSPEQVAELAARDDESRQQILECLEVAAGLGSEVSLGEWMEACSQLGLTCNEGHVQPLVDAGLAERTGDGWRFNDPQLVEALEQNARRENRWKRQRAASARALYAEHSTQCPEAAMRRVRFLAEAEKYEETLEPLLIAEQHHFDMGDYDQSEATLDTYDEMLDSMGADPDDELRGRSIWRRGRLCHNRGDLERGLELAERGESLLSSSQLAAEQGQAALQVGRIMRSIGEIDEAIEKTREAVRYFGKTGDDEGLARSRAALGMAHLALGDAKAARQHFERALTTFEALEDWHTVASLYNFIAQTWYTEDNHFEAILNSQRAREVARDQGDVINEAGAWNFEGEIARDKEEWDYAKMCYRRAAELFAEVGSRNEHVMRYNLALVSLGAGNFDAAEEQLVELEEVYADVGLTRRLPLLYSARIVIAAATGQPDRFDRLLPKCRESLAETGTAHRDIVTLLERAAEYLQPSDEPGRLERVESLTESQRRRLRGDVAEH